MRQKKKPKLPWLKNDERIQRHYHAIHAETSPVRVSKIQVYYQPKKGDARVACDVCWGRPWYTVPFPWYKKEAWFWARLLGTVPSVPFGHCGLKRVRFARWLLSRPRHVYYTVKYAPRNWWGRFDLWNGHRTGRYCGYIRDGKCIGCSRPRTAPYTK